MALCKVYGCGRIVYAKKKGCDTCKVHHEQLRLNGHITRTEEIETYWKAPKKPLSHECWMFKSKPFHPGYLNACTRCGWALKCLDGKKAVGVQSPMDFISTPQLESGIDRSAFARTTKGTRQLDKARAASIVSRSVANKTEFKCRICGDKIEPTEHQKKTYDYRCKKCTNIQRKEYLERRAIREGICSSV